MVLSDTNRNRSGRKTSIELYIKEIKKWSCSQSIKNYKNMGQDYCQVISTLLLVNHQLTWKMQKALSTSHTTWHYIMVQDFFVGILYVKYQSNFFVTLHFVFLASFPEKLMSWYSKRAYVPRNWIICCLSVIKSLTKSAFKHSSSPYLVILRKYFIGILL